VNAIDVTVIGGGLAGMAASIHLSKAGMRVLCIEPDAADTGSGRCEEIKKLVWRNVGSKKSRARMPSKRSLGRRHTFCISLDFGQIDFFTSSSRRVAGLVRTRLIKRARADYGAAH